jgi:SulP family sulfate permease
LKECPQLHIVRIDGSLFFGSEAYLREKFIQLDSDFSERKHLIILAEGIHFVDLAGAAVLGNEAKKRRMEGGGLYLVNVKPDLWDSFVDFNTFDQIDTNNIFQTKPDAIMTIFQKLDHEICRHCRVQAFFECATIEHADDPDTSQL